MIVLSAFERLHLSFFSTKCFLNKLITNKNWPWADLDKHVSVYAVHLWSDVIIFYRNKQIHFCWKEKFYFASYWKTIKFLKGNRTNIADRYCIPQWHHKTEIHQTKQLGTAGNLKLLDKMGWKLDSWQAVKSKFFTSLSKRSSLVCEPTCYLSFSLSCSLR